MGSDPPGLTPIEPLRRRGPERVAELGAEEAVVADAAGVGLYGGTLLEGSVGSVAAAHVFAACPTMAWGTELFGPLLLTDDVVVQRPEYRDFELKLPQTPGLGIQLDDDKLAFYRRDRRAKSVAVTA